MNKSVLLDADFSSLEKRVAALHRGKSKGMMWQHIQNLLKEGKSVMTTHNMVVSNPTTTDNATDAMLYGLLNPNWIWGDDLYVAPEPHCQEKAFAAIDKFWSARQLGLYGQYMAQLESNPKTKDVFKSKSTSHHFP